MPTRIERRLILRRGALVEFDVEVEDVPDFEAGRIDTYRVTTGEIERSREMTLAEQQLVLGDVGIRID